MFRKFIQRNSLLQQMVAVPATDPAQSEKGSVRPKSGLRLVVATIGLLGSYALLTTEGVAQIQQPTSVILSSAETDPVTMGWMQGSPPPLDKVIKFEDGSFSRFPQTRWSFSHYRELFPTARVTRGPGAIAPLPRVIRRDLDAVAFTPLGQSSSMTWAQAFEAVYGDAVIILHRGQIVYERYDGVTDGDTPHIMFSVSKSFSGTLAEMLIANGQLDENAKVVQYIPELASSGFGDATVRQILDMTTGLDYSENYSDPKAQVVTYAFPQGLPQGPRATLVPETFLTFLRP